MAQNGKHKNTRRMRFDELVEAQSLCRQQRQYKLPDVSVDNPIRARLSGNYIQSFFGYGKGTEIQIVRAYPLGGRIHLNITIDGDPTLRTYGCEVEDVTGV